MYAARIDNTQLSGGGYNEVAYHELRAGVEGGDGPFTYVWNDGETVPTRYVEVGPGDPTHVYTVTVTDTSDGTTVHARTEIPPPPGGCEDPSQVVCDS